MGDGQCEDIIQPELGPEPAVMVLVKPFVAHQPAEERAHTPTHTHTSERRVRVCQYKQAKP